MRIQHNIENDFAVFKISGSILAGEAYETKTYITNHIEIQEIKGIIIDCDNLETLDSGGIGMLLGIYKLMKKNNKKFALCSISKEVNQILEITGLDVIFDIFPSVRESVIYCQEQSIQN